jgi:inorganic pyrophosphatase/exopolyphosphatase
MSQSAFKVEDSKISTSQVNLAKSENIKAKVEELKSKFDQVLSDKGKID